jgi:hypothetical protein
MAQQMVHSAHSMPGADSAMQTWLAEQELQGLLSAPRETRAIGNTAGR